MTEAEGTTMRILITGASSGIGAATARALAGPGRTLLLNGRNEAALQEVAAEVRGLGGTAEAHPADLGDDAAVQRLADGVRQPLDVLVHAAGVVGLGSVAELPVAALDEQYRLNVRAPFALTQALLPRLREARGLVVFVNSGAGQRAKPDWGGYAASKFALRALADALRDEEAAAGVRVSSVYPGRTATPMQREVRRQEGGPYQPEAYLRPEAVANVIKDLIGVPASATVPDVSVRPG
ncbi:MAG: SDR family oxidoreductase [Trueperaceae bacterium]|nr:SDR family oxidoreductase [Trueperaceae bacterium]